MQTTSKFEFLPLDQIQESPLNPRKHFDAHKLDELTDSIRRQGIITPLIVRVSSIPADVQKGKLIDGYEIAAGHRRRRAAIAAGLTEVPCIIRELDDDAFAELLTIENLQREDIHPLEEGEGYRELLKRKGYDVAAIAEKIGKTEAYVYGRIQLCDLQEPAREAFLTGAITIGHARLIARLDASQQEASYKACFGYRGELHTTRDLKDWIQRDAGRDLAKAPFDLSDHFLVEKVPACVHCPKAAGVNPLLIDEDGEQTCLEPGCFDRKVQAHIAEKTKAGLVAISSAYQPEKVAPGVLCAREYEEIHTEPDDEDLGQVKEIERQLREEDFGAGDREMAERELKYLRESMAEHEDDCGHSVEAIVVDGYNDVGKVKRICRDPKCPVHGERLSLYDSKASTSEKAKQDREAEARKLKEKARIQAREQAVAVIADEIFVNGSRDFFDLLTRNMLHRLFSMDRARKLATLFDVQLPKKGNYSDAEKVLWKAYQGFDADTQNQMMVRLLLGGEVEASTYHVDRFDLLGEFAKACDVDLKKAEATVLAELKAAAKAKADKKAPAKPSSTKKSGKKTVTPKSFDRKRAAAGDEEGDDDE